MNILFASTDDVYKEQISLAQEMAEQVNQILSSMMGKSVHPLQKESVLAYYPSLGVLNQSSIVLDTFLESVKNYIFSDGLPVEEKISLFKYHFKNIIEQDNQHTLLRKVFDQTFMNNGKSLIANKQNYLHDGLSYLAKAWEPIDVVRETQQQIERHITKRQSELRMSQHINKHMKQHIPNTAVKQLENKFKELQNKKDAVSKQLENLNQQYRELYQEHFAPLLELSYDNEHLKQQMKFFWGAIVTRCIQSEQSAIPHVLQKDMFDEKRQDGRPEDDDHIVVIASTKHQGFK